MNDNANTNNSVNNCHEWTNEQTNQSINLLYLTVSIIIIDSPSCSLSN